MTIKVVLDTDIGTDIDDAVCLAYLLAHPACRLLGVTTVTGEAKQRAGIASAVCRAAGREVPVFPGAEAPLVVDQKQLQAPQATVLSSWPHRADFPACGAVDFLRSTVRQHPHEVVLLAVGPLTNIALLFCLDPGIPELLKGLVLMCGVYTESVRRVRPRERNASGDPHATAAVFRRAVHGTRVLGLDVTARVSMTASEIARRFRGPILKPVLDMAEVWFRDHDAITFHDPLAATTVFDDTLCRFENGRLAVDVSDPAAPGSTSWTPSIRGPHQLAVTVDTARFFRSFFSVFP